MPLRLVMMGTGEFALPALLSLYDSRHAVVGLFTQPDRGGEGHHHHANPMKDAALEQQTPVFQPHDAAAPESLADLEALRPDLCVVAAYGQILSPELIGLPRLGCVNLHASLLPKYRGAAPVHYAILRGEAETGVTIFQIEPKLDAGAILGITKTSIGPRETTGELTGRLAELAVPLVHRVLDQLESGTAKPVPQDASQISKAPRLKKTAGEIDWSQSAAEIDRHLRAMQPWPKPFTFLHHADREPLRLIVLEIEPAQGISTNGPPGTVLSDDSRLIVQTGDVPVAVRRLQPSGKRTMTAAEFLRGHALAPGDRLGAE
ncbi:MAG: methionyl-tRNA formyltransferase [Planctomycetaceae bacterium]